MKHFKPHLHLSKLRSRNFELSVIISVPQGCHLKKLPTPVIVPIKPDDPSLGEKHVLDFELVSDELATSSIINTTIQLTEKGEKKVEVRVFGPSRPPTPSGTSSAHYGDPKKMK